MEPFIPVNTIIAFILLCVVIYVGLKDKNREMHYQNGGKDGS